MKIFRYILLTIAIAPFLLLCVESHPDPTLAGHEAGPGDDSDGDGLSDDDEDLIQAGGMYRFAEDPCIPNPDCDACYAHAMEFSSEEDITHVLGRIGNGLKDDNVRMTWKGQTLVFETLGGLIDEVEADKLKEKIKSLVAKERQTPDGRATFNLKDVVFNREILNLD